MLRNRFDPTRPMAVATYLRMSSERQNPRSPQQQEDTIKDTVNRLKYPWKFVTAYKDEAISGRYVRKRPGLQKMLSDIRQGVIEIDAILVDTFERFGRADECGELRKELHYQHGVLILTADNNFADPTSGTGKIASAFESLRATEENRVKAHNVLRGKRDAAKQKHWPGAKAPFGFRLESVFKTVAGRQEIAYCTLVPEPQTGWIIKRIFALAIEKGWGCSRIARALNEDKDVPEHLKPFFAQTVNSWLKSPIYCGDLVWGTHSTEIIADRRVRERNLPEEELKVPEFCEPLIARKTWEEVQMLRSVRSERIRLARAAKRSQSKQIAAVTRGIALKYLLSGLVRCGVCERSMVASSGAPFITKAGELKRYVAYACPGFGSGVCNNKTRIPEEWLRETVISLVRARLFAPGS